MKRDKNLHRFKKICIYNGTDLPLVLVSQSEITEGEFSFYTMKRNNQIRTYIGAQDSICKVFFILFNDSFG